MAWTTSQRREQLPADWPSRRQAVLNRDRRRCVLCGASATQVDHITPGQDHRPSNLQSLCDPCHKAKTNLESQAARGVGPLRHRPAETHPGLK